MNLFSPFSTKIKKVLLITNVIIDPLALGLVGPVLEKIFPNFSEMKDPTASAIVIFLFLPTIVLVNLLVLRAQREDWLDGFKMVLKILTVTIILSPFTIFFWSLMVCNFIDKSC